MKVSNNSIQTFKRCRRMWELTYKYNLKPVSIAPALETGLTYHDKIESIVRTGNFKQDCDPKTNAMAFAFKKYIYPELRERFNPEVWFEYQTKGGNTVVGRYDGVGDKLILEHKTTSGRIDGSYWTALDLDEQILTYMMSSGKRKCFYTVCQRPSIRMSKNETVEVFQQRCIEWFDTDTESKIAYQIITHSPGEIRMFEQDIDSMCQEIERCDNFYRNTNYCMRWGRPCEFMSICRNYDPNQTYIGFERRE